MRFPCRLVKESTVGKGVFHLYGCDSEECCDGKSRVDECCSSSPGMPTDSDARGGENILKCPISHSKAVSVALGSLSYKSVRVRGLYSQKEVG